MILAYYAKQSAGKIPFNKITNMSRVIVLFSFILSITSLNAQQKISYLLDNKADLNKFGNIVTAELTEYGVDHSLYKEHLISLVKKGMDGAEQIARMMVDLRENPVTEIDGSKVNYVFDYELFSKIY